MGSCNLVVMMGNLTRDPETKQLPSGTTLCNFGLAVNSVTGKGDSRKEEVMFIDCAAFGDTATIIDKYLRKGDPAHIVGRLRLETWQGNDGVKHSRHSITVDRIQFLGPPRGGGKTASAGKPPPTGDDIPF